MQVLKVQLLLRPECRSPNGLNGAVATATALGLKVTGTGRATISAEIDSVRFNELFGAAVTPVAARGRGAADFGAPAGFIAEDDRGLRMPAELETLVSNVSVEPPHTRMH